MNVPTELVTAARIATAAVALVLALANPSAQPALADQPPAPTTPQRPSVRTAAPDPAVYSNGVSSASGGHLKVWFLVRNVGPMTSKSITVTTYCSYKLSLDLLGTSIVEVPAATKALAPLASQASSSEQTLDCAPQSGRTPVAARIEIDSQGDRDTSNNSVRAHS